MPDVGVSGLSGRRYLQVFTGLESGVIVVYPMKSKSEFPSAVQEFIRNYGAPIGFFTDNAPQQVSEIVKDLYRMYTIKDKQCEPHYQNQNPVERVIQELKRMALEIGKRVGVPPKYMMLLIMFTAELISRMANKDGKIPMQLLTGQPVDVSVYMDYHFWQLVITEDGDGKEILGRWCGPAYTQGDALTYQILCQESGNVGEDKSGMDTEEFTEDWSQKWISLENSL